VGPHGLQGNLPPPGHPGNMGPVFQGNPSLQGNMGPPAHAFPGPPGLQGNLGGVGVFAPQGNFPFPPGPFPEGPGDLGDGFSPMAGPGDLRGPAPGLGEGPADWALDPWGSSGPFSGPPGPPGPPGAPIHRGPMRQEGGESPREVESQRPRRAVKEDAAALIDLLTRQS